MGFLINKVFIFKMPRMLSSQGYNILWDFKQYIKEGELCKCFKYLPLMWNYKLLLFKVFLI